MPATVPATMKKTGATDDLLRIPGVGKSIAQDLHDLGIMRVADLRQADPEALYDNLCALRGAHIDRCVLYTFRCAVYFASDETHDPELLKWWNWKDRTR
jgi:pathogenicity locus Cdd1 protein